MNLEELQLARVPKAEIMPAEQFDLQRTKLRADYAQVVEFGKKITVTDDDSLKEAVQIGKLLQAASKQLDGFYKPIKQAFDAAKSVVTDKEKLDVAELKTLKDSLAAQILAYQQAQEKIRQEELRLAQAAAAKLEEERRLQEAIELEAQGFKEEAAQVLDEVRLAPAVIVQAAPKKIAGSVTRTTWTAQVDDLGKLVKAVAAGVVPMLALTPNHSWLNTQATAYNEGLNFPGVSVKHDTKGHFRS